MKLICSLRSAPVITAVNGRPGTAGGDSITITGRNFGQGSPPTISFLTCTGVQFVSGSNYKQLTCKVLFHSELPMLFSKFFFLQAVPGTGKGHKVMVTVDGQNSNNDKSFDYAGLLFILVFLACSSFTHFLFPSFNII